MTLLIFHDHKHLLWVMFSKIEQITRKSSSLCSSLRFFRSSSFSLSFSSNSSWLSSKCFHQFSSDQVNVNIPRNVQTSSTLNQILTVFQEFWEVVVISNMTRTRRFEMFLYFFHHCHETPSYLQPLFERGPEVVVNFLLELYSSPTFFAWQPKNSLKTSTEYSFP